MQTVFGHAGMENEQITTPNPSAFGAVANILVPKLPGGLANSLSHDKSTVSSEQSKTLRNERHAVRPPVQHKWCLPDNNVNMKPPQIFQHELLQNFSINMFCKYNHSLQIPVNKARTYGDLRNVLMKRIFMSALHFRINSKYKSSNPPFTSVELDHSDSGREGCTVTTLTVTAEPNNWRDAIRVAVQEVRRLKEFGVTRGELARYLDTRDPLKNKEGRISYLK